MKMSVALRRLLDGEMLACFKEDGELCVYRVKHSRLEEILPNDDLSSWEASHKIPPWRELMTYWGE